MAQAIRDELIEELVQGYSSPQDLLGEEGLFKELKKRLLERALGAELSEHLGYEKGDPAGRGGGNSRNGYSSKTVIGDDGAIEIAVPRDRNGSFEPQIVAKGQTRLDGFDNRIISLYARGLSVREIQALLLPLNDRTGSSPYGWSTAALASSLALRATACGGFGLDPIASADS